MTVHSAPSRPWHVSATLLDSASHGSLQRHGDTPSGADRPVPVAVKPLWRRIVTGQVIGWRIRLMASRLLRVRRSAARRALAGLDRHPEFHDVLADEGPVAFARFAVSSARTARTTRSVRPARPTRRSGYRPSVNVPAGLDVSGLRGSVALAGVELNPATGPTTTSRAEFAKPLIELRVGDAGADAVAPPIRLLDAVDMSIWNPKWFRTSPDPHAVQLSELPLRDTPRAARARARIAGRARLVVCGDLATTNAAETAAHLAQLAMSGLPIVGDLTDEVAEYLGDDVTMLVRSTSAAHLADDERRERYSIALRRAAFDSFSPRARWRLMGAACGEPTTATPSVTVLLASNRPDDVIEAARQIAAQRVGFVQLVVGLHGSHMSPALDDRLAESFSGDLIVRHLPDEFNLGQVLNALTAEADGEFVTKWDDDDWYDGEHLADLVAALEYSGADMVAKAAEFVYLESLDLTVRRFATGSERFSTTVAGGTLLLPRTDLQQIGWADAPRRVDRLLIDALERRSGRVYRTHGFGYVLRRRGGALGQHTWQAGDAYFLRQSVDQRPGLDLAFAGFSSPSSAEVAS
jgi:hypothetical protein